MLFLMKFPHIELILLDFNELDEHKQLYSFVACCLIPYAFASMPIQANRIALVVRLDSAVVSIRFIYRYTHVAKDRSCLSISFAIDLYI